MWGPLVVALCIGALRDDPPPVEPPPPSPATEPAPEVEPAPVPEPAPAPRPDAVPDVIPEPAPPAPALPPTNGIRIGRATLHPFLSGTGSYDTAVVSGASGNAGDVLARARAGFDIKTDLESTRIAANLTAGYDLFAGAGNPASRSLSFLSWGGLLDLNLNRTGRVRVDLKLISRRSDDTDNTIAMTPLLSLYNLARVTVPIRVSDKLTLKPLVQIDYDAFSPLDLPLARFGDITSDPSRVYEMSYLDFRTGLDAHWRLVPSTALVASATFDVRNYPFAQSLTGGYLNSDSNLPAELLKITAGATSALTTSLSAELLIGVGADFAGTNARTAIGQATLGWQTERFGARLGYVRTMNPIPIFGVMTQDRIFAETLVLPREGLMLSLFAVGDNVSYAQTMRSDQLLTARASVEWQVVSVLSVGFSYRLNVRLSSVASTPLNFIRHEPMLTLSATWRDVPDRVPAWSEVPTRIEVPRAMLLPLTM
jgi:hypothetical protein